MMAPLFLKTCLHVSQQSKIFWAHLRYFFKEVLIPLSGKWYLENNISAQGMYITSGVLILLDLFNEQTVYLF